MNIIFNYYIIEHNLEKMLSLFINISNIILKIKQFMTKKKRKEKKIIHVFSFLIYIVIDGL